MKKKVLQLVMGGWMNALVSGLLGIYVARILGPADRGVLALATGSIVVLASLFNFGAPQAAAFFVRARPRAEAKVLTFVNKTLIAVLLGSIGLVGLGSSLFSKLFLDRQSMDVGLMTLMVISVTTCSANGMFQGLMIAKGEAKATAMAIGIGSIITALTTVLLIRFFDLRIHGALAGATAGQAITNLILRIKYSEIPKEGGNEVLTYSEFFTYGLKTQTGNLASLFFKRLDLFFIGGFLNTSAVGYYSIGLSLRDFFLTFGRSVTGLVAGEMTDPKLREGNKDLQLLRKGMLFNFGFSSLVAIGSLLTLPILIPMVYGIVYKSAIIPSIIILFSAIPFSIAILYSAAITASGMPMIMSSGNIIAAAFGVTTVWFLTKYFGLIGSAASTVAVAIVLLVTNLVLFHFFVYKKRPFS